MKEKMEKSVAARSVSHCSILKCTCAEMVLQRLDVRKGLIRPGGCWGQRYIEKSDYLREEAILKSGCGSTDAPVTFCQMAEG